MPGPDPLQGRKPDTAPDPLNSQIRIRNTETEAHYGVGKAHNRATEAHHGAEEASRTKLQIRSTMLSIRILMKKLGPYPNPHQSETSVPHQHQSEKSDLDPHQRDADPQH
jgi:hypothetical protein